MGVGRRKGKEKLTLIIISKKREIISKIMQKMMWSNNRKFF